ncbi:hypothetical protein [Planktothricoides raciborskii]|uniref:Uncharacterized protein n=1 Tax=Planktothricoides raciborskii GIHE-MW2 TaxID=2792601 RepID=A0AAU8JFU2_9CYAN
MPRDSNELRFNMPRDSNELRCNVSGSVYGSLNTGQIANNILTAGCVVNAQKQRLTEAAAEIQKILDQLSQNYPTITIADKATVAAKAMEEMEQKPEIKMRIIKALQAGTTAEIIELIDNPVVKIMTPMFDDLTAGVN